MPAQLRSNVHQRLTSTNVQLTRPTELCRRASAWAAAGSVAWTRAALAGFSAGDSRAQPALAYFRARPSRSRQVLPCRVADITGRSMPRTLFACCASVLRAPAVALRTFAWRHAGHVGSLLIHPELVRALILGRQHDRRPNIFIIRCTRRCSRDCATSLARAVRSKQIAEGIGKIVAAGCGQR